MPEELSGLPPSAPSVMLVPCAQGESIGCRIVRRAVELVADQTPEAAVTEAESCPRQGRPFLVAVDASNSCQASAALRERGIRLSAVVSAPDVLARAGLVRPGIDLRARTEELAGTLADAIRDSLAEVLEEIRDRRRYREEMAPILRRFDGIWKSVEGLPPPNSAPSASDARPVELLGKRARNLFVKFDEVIPPARWAEAHDLFQDALLCIAYACEGWATGDTDRWEQNLEKATVQIGPLRRRLGG
jgi:hypothetical protein